MDEEKKRTVLRIIIELDNGEEVTYTVQPGTTLEDFFKALETVRIKKITV